MSDSKSAQIPNHPTNTEQYLEFLFDKTFTKFANQSMKEGVIEQIATHSKAEIRKALERLSRRVEVVRLADDKFDPDPDYFYGLGNNQALTEVKSIIQEEKERYG